MVKRAPASKLKQKVSPIWVVVALIVIVGVALTIMFIIPAIKASIKAKKGAEATAKYGYGPGGVMSAIVQMLGANIKPMKVPGKGVLWQVTYVMSQDANELQKGDFIASINGTQVTLKDSGILDELEQVPEGQTVDIGVIRDGQEMTVQITRNPWQKLQ